MNQSGPGPNIRRLRQRKCWSQENLAEAAGVSLRTIQRLEKTGQARPGTLAAVADAFDIDRASLGESLINHNNLAPSKITPRLAFWVGLILTLPGLLFVASNIIRYPLGFEAFWNPFEPFLANRIGNAVSPWLFLGGPLLALAINVRALLQLDLQRQDRSWRLAGLHLTMAPPNLLLIASGLLTIAVLLAYLILENLGHWIGAG